MNIMLVVSFPSELVKILMERQKMFIIFMEIQKLTLRSHAALGVIKDAILC